MINACCRIAPARNVPGATKRTFAGFSGRNGLRMLVKNYPVPTLKYYTRRNISRVMTEVRLHSTHTDTKHSISTFIPLGQRLFRSQIIDCVPADPSGAGTAWYGSLRSMSGTGYTMYRPHRMSGAHHMTRP